ncbi:MAG: SAM-dependent methyltransferase [Wolbachia endosymbiont of Menacanthus eurysternus]|nr:MAG: SAM-dependent methyltransferase [Wolbachia endosymbiont of Menacanthus eurysternus]
MLTYLHRLIDKNQGSISISDFMRIALYHNEYGYYMSKLSFGKDGDFITAPEISQLFGEIIAVWVICIWEKLGRPSKFSLVELGPGRGTLILDIIRVTRRYSDFFNSMSIHLIEISPILQKIQKQKLKSLDVSWHENINSLPKQATIFLANEFFDALPINQFVYYNERWYENRVTKRDNGSLFIIADRFSVKKEIMYFNTALNSKLFYGAVVEVSSFRIDILKKLEEKIYNNKGAALIIDYGYIYPEYRSTLQSLKQHKYVSIFEDIGSSDITALVNFQELIDSLRYVDYEILTQREFLYIFGIKERVQALMKNLNSTQKNKIFCEYLRLTKNMGTLFKVMMIYCL